MTAAGKRAAAEYDAADPITRSVIRRMLPAIADEMSYLLQRSSYNMMIYEVRDYCCALVSPDGALLSQNLGGVSHFVADLGVIIEDAMARYGADGFRPGDGFITNHQAVAGQHLNNVVTYTPVFADGELLCFALVRAHWIDIGGMSTGFGGGTRVTDPWVEGLQLNQVRAYEAGEPDEQVLGIIRDNIRFPTSSFGDMRAQFAACRLAEERLRELVGRYGRATFEQTVAELFAESEARCRRVIEQFPDGEYYAESQLDHDYGDEREPLEIKVKVTVAGSDLTIDLTRCSTQRKSAVNGRTLAGAYIAYKALTTPLEAVNQGSFRALKVEIQEGNFMMARYPAPMAAWSTALPLVVDTIFAALAPAIKDAVPAAHSGTLGGTLIFIGTDPDTGERFVTQSIEGSGWGGRPHEDGESASVSVCQGDVRNAPIEAMELKWPILVNRRELRRDSGGAGRYRGGMGLTTEVTNLVEGAWSLVNFPPREKYPPWGLWGGRPGAMGTTSLRLPGSAEELHRVGRVTVAAGATQTINTPGGGGWGDPVDRPAGDVAADVRDGYVSPEAARDLYGVVLQLDEHTGLVTVDAAATDTRRGELRVQAVPGTTGPDATGPSTNGA
jgi:N-methylhydantoinase B